MLFYIGWMEKASGEEENAFLNALMVPGWV